jgi:hypothetical protein
MHDVRVAVFNNEVPGEFLILRPDDQAPWTLPGTSVDPARQSVDTAVRHDVAFGELRAPSLIPQMAGEVTLGEGEPPVIVYAGRVSEVDLNPNEKVAGFRWTTEAELPEHAEHGYIMAVVEVGRQALRAA